VPMLWEQHVQNRSAAVFADLTWVIGGKVHTHPTREVLLQCKEGDFARLGPGCTKPDQFGEVHAPYGSVLPFRDSDMCAAKHLQQIELTAKCYGSNRDTTPIFTDEQGKVLTHSTLDGLLAEMLTFCYDEAVARTHSWHSVRIGLACALHAAGAPDEVIQLLCRWISVDSLRLYRRVGTSQNVMWCDAAEQAKVDSRQLGNLPILDGSDSFAALQSCADNTDEPERHTLPAKAPCHADIKVMVPRGLWPHYPCTELQGEGWEANIVSRSEKGVKVEFVHAKTPDGKPYQKVTLDPDCLRPLPADGGAGVDNE
jgi:hypothetical protein